MFLNIPYHRISMVIWMSHLSKNPGFLLRPEKHWASNQAHQRVGRETPCPPSCCAIGCVEKLSAGRVGLIPTLLQWHKLQIGWNLKSVHFVSSSQLVFKIYSQHQWNWGVRQSNPVEILRYWCNRYGTACMGKIEQVEDLTKQKGHSSPCQRGKPSSHNGHLRSVLAQLLVEIMTYGQLWSIPASPTLTQSARNRLVKE